jgi:hypothetical protein
LSRRFLGWACATPFILAIAIALPTTLAASRTSNDAFQNGGLAAAMWTGVVAFLAWPIILLIIVFGRLGQSWRMWDWVILLLFLHGVVFAALGFYLLSMVQLNF